MENSLATCLFTHGVAFGRIIVVPRTWHHNGEQAMAINAGRQKCSELHHWSEFLHTYESVHDGNHDGV